MRIGERYGRGFGFGDEADELTPQDMILEGTPLDDDEEAVPTVRGGQKPSATAPPAAPSRTLIPPPSQAGGDEALDIASIMREPASLPLPTFQSMDFDETPMPTAANAAGSVAPVAMPVEDQDEDEWIEDQLRRTMHHRARWPYALGGMAALGIALVAISGWKPSWNQGKSPAAVAPPVVAAVAPAGVPVYRAEDLPVANVADDPEVVYQEIQAQLDQEAREAALERDRREAREERERRRAERAQEQTAPSSSSEATAAEATAGQGAEETGETQPGAGEQPPSVAPPFDRDAANAALEAAAAAAASGCRAEGVPGGQAVRVAVTFAPSGRVNSAQIVEGALLGTSVGSCVARSFHSAQVNAFSGPIVTVYKTVRLQ